MKITINYEYAKKHKMKVKRYFTLSENEEKLPRDYIVYAIIAVKNKDYYLISYDSLLTFVPKFITKEVENKLDSDWVYINKDKGLLLETDNTKIKISKYIGPMSFIEDEALIPDILNDSVTIFEFNFFYLYNIPCQTNNKYMLNAKDKKVGLLNNITGKVVVDKVQKFKVDRYKKEIYVIGNLKKEEYFVVNYETDEVLKYKMPEDMDAEHKFIFENNSDFLSLDDQII